MKEPIPPAEPLLIALRAYLQPLIAAQAARRSYRQPEPSTWSLVFDVETTTDAAQQRRLVPYQVWRGDRLHDQGIGYEPQMLTENELRLLHEHANAHGYRALTVAEFVEQLFFPVAYELGGCCIGFNLPFDLSRLAIAHAHARKQFRGGFTFQLSSNRRRPGVRVKHLNARAALIQFAVPAGRSPEQRARERGAAIDHHHGHFCDVKSLGSALTAQGHSLASLAKLLDTPHKKLETDEHGGLLTADYLDYALNDVQVTWECFSALRLLYDSYQLRSTPLAKVKSEASLGKASLKELGVQSWRRAQPHFPPGLIGIILGSYFGGRAAVHLRREVARVLYCDFLSMYPTVCALMGLWRYATAQRIEYQDATEEIRARLAHLTITDLRQPKFWSSLQVLVQIDPQEDLLPTRGDYVGNGQYAIGLNYRSGGEPVWHTLGDIIVSWLLTGRAPEILKALRFEAVGVQPGLRSLDLLGNPAYRVDPAAEDVYKRLIDLRNEIKRAQKLARTAGDHQQADQLDSEQRALKIMANAVSYGIFVELNVLELANREERTCYGPDGRDFTTLVNRVEEPGQFFHPLLATLITGAARLMLAVAETLIEVEGLSWLFCDTDSMAIAKPTEMGEEEFVERTRRVCDWFLPLNPYHDKQALFKIEDTNYRLDANGHTTPELEALYGVAISAKRHALFNLDENGKPVIRKASAHGLGHLQAPYRESEGPAAIPWPRVSLAELSVDRWQHDVWYRIVESILAGESQPRLDDLPAFERPAMMRYSATTRAITDWFRTYNADRPYEEQLRPFGFFSVPLIARDGYPVDTNPDSFLLFSPYLSATSKATTSAYLNAHATDGEHYSISTSIRSAEIARAQSYREIVLDYATHAEPKSLGPDGEACHRATTGLLSPRHVHSIQIEAIGKESNRVEEQGLVSAEDAALHYMRANGDPWATCVLPALSDFELRDVARLTGLTERGLRDLASGRSRPQPANLRMITAAAALLARKRLRTLGTDPHRNDLSCLHQYLAARGQRAAINTCDECGVPLPGTGRTLCDACKQRAYRRRVSRRAIRFGQSPLDYSLNEASCSRTPS